MDILTTLIHILYSWWFFFIVFGLPIIIAIIGAIMEGLGGSIGGGSGGGSGTGINPPSQWSMTEKMKHTTYAQKMQECWMKGRC